MALLSKGEAGLNAVSHGINGGRDPRAFGQDGCTGRKVASSAEGHGPKLNTTGVSQPSASDRLLDQQEETAEQQPETLETEPRPQNLGVRCLSLLPGQKSFLHEVRP